MSEQKMPFSRRRFLATTALGAAAAASGSLAMPSLLRAQGAGVKLGLLHPVTGALSYSGQQGRIGATMAVDEINAAGGIKALGGAKIEPILGDAQSTPDGGTAEVEKMNSAGVSLRRRWLRLLDLPRRQPGCGALRSALCGRRRRRRFHRHPRAQEHLPLRSRLRRHRQDGARQSDAINDQAGKPAKTVIIVHEDSLFGSGLAKLLNAQLPAKGFEILETIPHPTPIRDFANVVLKIKAQNPDIVIPANYYNEYVLFARTMQEQHVRPKGIYSVLGGAASSYKFVKEFPEAAKYIMDCNHWYNPKSAKAQELKKKVEDKGQFFTYELYLNYNAVLLVADALGACGVDRSRQNHRRSGKLDLLQPDHALRADQVRQRPEQGAAPVNTQVLDNDIKVILPPEFANAKAVFPMPA